MSLIISPLFDALVAFKSEVYIFFPINNNKKNKQKNNKIKTKKYKTNDTKIVTSPNQSILIDNPLPQQPINLNYVLKLQNEGENCCYANAITQALLSLGNPFYQRVRLNKI